MSSTLTTSTSFPSSLTHGLTTSSTTTSVPVPVSARSLCGGQPYYSRPIRPPPAAMCCRLSSQHFSQYRCVLQRPALQLSPTRRSFCPAPFGLSPTAAALADRIFWVLSTPSCLPQVPKLHLLVSPCHPHPHLLLLPRASPGGAVPCTPNPPAGAQSWPSQSISHQSK